MLDLAYPLARNADKLDLILQHLEKKQLGEEAACSCGAALLHCSWYEQGKTPHDKAVDKDETKRMASYFSLINPLGSRREPQGEVNLKCTKEVSVEILS